VHHHGVAITDVRSQEGSLVAACPVVTVSHQRHGEAAGDGNPGGAVLGDQRLHGVRGGRGVAQSRANGAIILKAITTCATTSAAHAHHACALALPPRKVSAANTRIGTTVSA
jgi:hypothetical protein